MAATVPNYEPTSFTAGDYVPWTKSLDDYPPSEGWTLAYQLVLGSTRVPATVTDDDASEYTASFAANDATISAITERTEARLIGYVTGSGDYAGQRFTVYDGGVTIEPNPASMTLDGARSDAQIEYDAVTAAILALTTTNIQSYSIGGRAVTKLDLKALYARQATLASTIRAEKGLGFRKRQVTFVSP